MSLETRTDLYTGSRIWQFSYRVYIIYISNMYMFRVCVFLIMMFLVTFVTVVVFLVFLLMFLLKFGYLNLFHYITGFLLLVAVSATISVKVRV